MEKMGHYPTVVCASVYDFSIHESRLMCRGCLTTVYPRNNLFTYLCSLIPVPTGLYTE